MRKLGVLINCGPKTDVMAEFKRAVDFGMQTCQLCIWNQATYTDEKAAEINEAREATGLEISTLWAGWSGPKEWNFIYGPSTLGLVPPAYRMQRLAELHNASAFAAKINVRQIATHVGFLPENPDDINFTGTVAALRNLATAMAARGQYFLFETGQETPVTMLRTIETIGTSNLGINFDTANLILYGKANPLDALDIFGKYVMDTHLKDGLYPTDGMKLGKQVPLGQGRANIPAIVDKLDALGYTGAYTIECELKGDDKIALIRDAQAYMLDIFERKANSVDS
ncbi:MAG: sugar phosphate isomerase/epimerase [Clostridiales bacterium]|nr:sugar phosphate isomerase/epimerase [Clostridiales bacterium]